MFYAVFVTQFIIVDLFPVGPQAVLALRIGRLISFRCRLVARLLRPTCFAGGERGILFGINASIIATVMDGLEHNVSTRSSYDVVDKVT